MSSASGDNPPRGGAGTQKTPATNIGGGSGLGDTGYPKGNTSITGQFKTLNNQKVSAREHDEHGETGTTGQQEDHSFMGHKPGHGGTLPGWDKLKDMTGYKS